MDWMWHVKMKIKDDPKIMAYLWEDGDTIEQIGEG